MEPLVQSIVINRPIEEVFDGATCQERCLICEDQLSPQARQAMAQLTWDQHIHAHKVSFLGITVDAEPVITAWEPPYRAEFENRTGPVHYDSTFTFEPTEQGTKMTTQILAQTGGAFRHIPDRLVQNTIARQHKADLAALKELLETETAITV